MEIKAFEYFYCKFATTNYWKTNYRWKQSEKI